MIGRQLIDALRQAEAAPPPSMPPAVPQMPECPAKPPKLTIQYLT